MSEPSKPEPGTKASRLAAANERVIFWKIWAEESIAPESKAYFQSRLNFWERTVQHIENEPV
jgi:hypothetical protein